MSNKNSKYTQQFRQITDKYDLDLDKPWNKEKMQHQGRHPNEYHQWMLDNIIEIDKKANGNQEVFLNAFEEVKNIVISIRKKVTAENLYDYNLLFFTHHFCQCGKLFTKWITFMIKIIKINHQ
mgnify:CR=1 FL=1